MKRILGFLTTLCALVGCQAEGIKFQSVDVATFAEIIKDSNVVLLDVRTPSEYQQGHIPGAINVANESISTEAIPELPDKNQLIMVYCRSGRRSKEAAEKLVKLGYTNIVEFGGILDWKGEIVTD